MFRVIVPPQSQVTYRFVIHFNSVYVYRPIQQILILLKTPFILGTLSLSEVHLMINEWCNGIITHRGMFWYLKAFGFAHCGGFPHTANGNTTFKMRILHQPSNKKNLSLKNKNGSIMKLPQNILQLYLYCIYTPKLCLQLRCHLS